jgi:hypothetical protein
MNFLRAFAAISALLLVACATPGGAGQQEATAKDVAADSQDFPGMQACPESGTWDQYLAALQKSDPNSYESEKQDWDDLKAAGATDGYVASYAEKPSECGRLTGNMETTGKAAYVFAVHFKDENGAKSSYKKSADTFHVSDSDVNNIKAVGGTVTEGSATGLGDNSIVVSASVAGFGLYISLWQKKKFLAAVIGLNLSAADGKAATQRVDGRIH